MKKLICSLAATLVALTVPMSADAYPRRSVISNSANGAFNTINVVNRGWSGGVLIHNSGNGVGNTINVYNVGKGYGGQQQQQYSPMQVYGK